MKIGLAMMRWIVGGLFVGHGLQKLAGWFGGHGLEATGKAFEGMGLRPGRAQAALAGAGEAGGGALVALGLLTPLGSSMISGAMITAIRKVHGSKGPWLTDGGYEYNLVLLAAVFVLAEAGPGQWSLDDALGTRRSGFGWAIAQLAGGAIGSTLALEAAKRQPAPVTPQDGQSNGTTEAAAHAQSPAPASNGQAATA
jgi:putative oxidoreductase